MLITKLPKNINPAMPKIKSSAKKRQLLTKPSSWAKLGVLIVISGLLVWLNLRPAKQDTRYKKQETNLGHAENTSPEKVETAKEPVVVPAQPEIDEFIKPSAELEELLKAGNRFLDDNRIDLALQSFKKASEIAPDYRDVWYLLGFTYLKLYEQNPGATSEKSFSNLQLAKFAFLHAKALDPFSKKIDKMLELTENLNKANN